MQDLMNEPKKCSYMQHREHLIFILFHIYIIFLQFSCVSSVPFWDISHYQSFLVNSCSNAFLIKQPHRLAPCSDTVIFSQTQFSGFKAGRSYSWQPLCRANTSNLHAECVEHTLINSSCQFVCISQSVWGLITAGFKAWSQECVEQRVKFLKHAAHRLGKESQLHATCRFSKVFQRSTGDGNNSLFFFLHLNTCILPKAVENIVEEMRDTAIGNQ